jgi:hypothetical protein
MRFFLLFVCAGLSYQVVSAQCPVNANFTASSVYVNQGQSVTFTNISTGPIIGQGWTDNGTLFSTSLSPSYVFSVPGLRTIRLIVTNGSCSDTATTLVMVSPTMSGSITPTNPTCFNGTNGSANLTPAGGHQNISIDNNRTINDYAAANTVTGAGYTNGITVEAWVKPRSTWTTGDGLFVAFNNQTGTYNRFFVGYNPAFQQFVYFDDNLGNQFQNSTSPRGFWYHVVVTISSANVMNMYINGVLRKTATTNANWIPVASELFSIGQEWDNAAGLVTSQHFDGQLDEVRIWNTVLTPATITANYTGCMSVNSSHPNIANLVTYYSMNEGSGSFLFDRSGNGHHGARVNGSGYGTVPLTNWGCFSSGTGYGYSWSNGATTQDISSIGAGTYTVTVIDGGSSTVNVSTTLTNPAPVVVSINPPGPVPICVGNSTSLTASGANTYVWSPATGLSSTTLATVTANPTGTITYTCVGTNAVGCTGQSTVEVVVNPLPTASITGTTTICTGDTTILTAAGGTSYAWSNGTLVAGNSVSPGTTTPYTVTVTDANNCQDTETATVTVNPLPVVTFTGVDTICDGDTTTITASGGTGYVWSNGPTTAAVLLNPNTTTTYTVTVTDANTCENTGSIAVTVNPLPSLSFAGTDSICLGDTTLITVSGAQDYAWGHGPTTAIVDLSPTANTYYDVMAIDANGCVATDSLMITVHALPTVAISGVDTLCAGDTTALVASGGSSYSWNTGDLTALINVGPITTTDYYVVGTDSNGCDGSDSITVVVHALPIATITGIDTICEGDSTTLTASGGGTYFWSTFSALDSITVGPVTNTTYTVTVTDANGCEGTASATVVVNTLPTTPVISQNGNTMSAPAGFSGYQWYLNGLPISGANSDSYTGTQSGIYTVTVTNAAGCEATSTDYNFIFVSIGQVGMTSFGLAVYPNPNDGRFTLQLDLERDRSIGIGIYDLVGKQVWSHSGDLPYGEWKQDIDLSQLAKGTYLLQVISEGQRMTRKIVVE